MTADLLLAIDQGTTSTRAIAYDRQLRPVASASIRLETSHPRPGWVEQDPEAILASVVDSVARVLDAVGGVTRIAAVGLDNQGETVVAWDATDGHPLAPAVVWQCRRSLPIVERLRAAGHEPAIRTRTGLPLDPYYSAGKMAWLLEHDDAVGRAAASGSLRFGTVDAWLTARLGGDACTDPSTASRTQLLSLATLDWDAELLTVFGVVREMLPRIVPTAGDLGRLVHSRWRGPLPLRALACDQQAALAGHGGFEAGAIKATYGTGAFVVANAGPRREPAEAVETSIAWTLPGGTTHAVVQAGVFTAGAFLEWLRDGLGLIGDPAETDDLAGSVADTAGVHVLPALAGLGAPWWRPDATAIVAGLRPGVTRAHVARAALDAIAQSVADVVETMAPALPASVSALRVDGGLTANRYLMQRQADVLGLPIEVASIDESTAIGIAALAGIGEGLLEPGAVERANPPATRLAPRAREAERARDRAAWRAFVAASVDPPQTDARIRRPSRRGRIEV